MRQTLVDISNQDAVSAAAEILREDGVILFPTDTLYGLGADALSDEAVAKIIDIKGRDERKPIHAIVADLEMAERYAYVDDNARKLAERFFPGALTLILKKREGVDTGIAQGIDTFGIRIPDSEFCIDLAAALDRPVTATSANRSGDEPLRDAAAIVAQLGIHAENLSLVVDAGELPERLPSTVVDLSRGRPVILREGAISADEIWDTLVELED